MKSDRQMKGVWRDSVGKESMRSGGRKAGEWSRGRREE